MTTTQQTRLPPHTRGDTFKYHFTLGNGWFAAHFTGGIKFTLREEMPSSDVTSDADAVYQASSIGGQITFTDDTSGIVEITDSSSDSWPTKTLKWDLQGVVTGPPRRTYTIDAGTILILPDITRSH